MSDPKLDAKLREYLEDRALEKAEGITLKTVYEACRDNTNRILALEQRVANHAPRLRAVELREEQRSIAEPGPNWKAESTGVYDVKYLSQKERERESDARALRRQTRDWIVRAVGALILVFVTAYVTATVARATQPTSAQPK